MLLCFDIGNTNITMGCFAEEKLLFVSRLFALRQKTSDEYASSLDDALHLNGIGKEQIDGAIISSVVPELTDCLFSAIKTVCGVKALIVGPDCCGGFHSDALPTSQIGADLIVDTVAATASYPLPCLVADLGTATKIIVINSDGRFAGCTIAPGVKISLDALAHGTALLPAISFTTPEKAIGTNTIDCMRSGIVFGTAAMLDGMIERILEELGVDSATLVATGGYSRFIVPCCKRKFIYDEHLLLNGLRMIYDLAAK